MPGSAARTIRLFLVDDHALFRDGLARLLTGDAEFELVGIAGTLDQALTGLAADTVDVLLLDYMLGEQPADTLVARLRENGFPGKILLVTAGLPDREAREMIGAGVAGIFHKQHATDDLKRSICEVFDGNVLIEAHYLQKLVQVVATDAQPALSLTPRQRA